MIFKINHILFLNLKIRTLVFKINALKLQILTIKSQE